ncbi:MULTISPECIES: Uma2 family endonuclease [Spirulina sp. CCY15215]|uniref:Uma2 family endonuclease n=1 Tax=Spirulina sp. CCY15215 TaxID=2767591 RepID=UPI0019508068|nr:Uma2 family endonuclease [Spirulina major]
MVVATQRLSYAEFLAQCPEDGRYELVNGEIVKLQPIRAHKNVARYLIKCFDRESEGLEQDYVIDKDIVIRTQAANDRERGRNPDVAVVPAAIWNANVMTYGALTEPPLLAVEVVSTNWDDDYIDKLAEYEQLGIQEYWIVDYLAVASRSYLGNPKVPTVFVYQLHEGKYQQQKFTVDEPIISGVFPELTLTVTQIINATQIG